MDLQTEKFSIVVKERKITLPIESDYDLEFVGYPPASQKSETQATNNDGGKVRTIGELVIDPEAVIDIKRIGRGEIIVVVKYSEKNKEGLFLTIAGEEEDEEYITDSITITIREPETRLRQGRSFLASFTGIVSNINKVGVNTGSTQPIIRSGSVYIINNTILGDTFYEVGPFNISPGDGISFNQNSGEKKNSNGFFTLNNEEPGIQLVANSKATGEIAITRFKHEDLTIKVSAWQKIMHDKTLAFLWACLIFVFPFTFGLY